MQTTYSMCQFCYRHLPATRIFKSDGVFLEKICKIHGKQLDLIDPDTEFYKNLKYKKRPPSSYWLDISNRCNLACPHCYQIPDNKSIDPSINTILNEIKTWPDDKFPISLVGAEPTTRRDLAEIINKINILSNNSRMIVVVTNGINLAKESYAKEFEGIKNLKWTFGLNHPDYNGIKNRKKQEVGLDNCLKYNLTVKTLTYTLGNLEQLPFVLEEIKLFNKKGVCDNARIQVGVDIGRTPNEEFKEIYLSDLVKKAINICNEKSYSFKFDQESSSRTHYAAFVDNILIKFIKWCDVRTIDFEETQSESWAKLIPNFPMTNLLHQIILRDRVINNNLPLLDSVPSKYTYNEITKQNFISV